MSARFTLALFFALLAPAVSPGGVLNACSSAIIRALGWSGHRIFVAEDGTKLELARDNYNVLANGHMVSGPMDYPLSLVLNHLELDSAPLSPDQGKTLSVGEGYSGLLDELKKSGIDAYALDIWYHQPAYPPTYIGDQMARYCKRHGNSLIRGSALEMPVPSASVHRLYSHMVVNNLSAEDNHVFLEEAWRVLDDGGEARIFGFPKEQIPGLERFLKERFQESISYELREKGSRWFHPYAGPLELRKYLLVIKKKS